MSQSTVKTQNQDGRNLPSTAWIPGQSGNPGGRPKDMAQVRELAKKHTPQAIATLAEIMEDTKQRGSTRVAAAGELLDRAWGKPTQPIEHQVGEQSIIPMDEVERRLREIGRLPSIPPSPEVIEATEDHKTPLV